MVDRWIEYKEKCKKKYGNSNFVYVKRRSASTIDLVAVDDGEYKELDIYMYLGDPNRKSRAITLKGYELKEFALAILEYLGYDVYLKEIEK